MSKKRNRNKKSWQRARRAKAKKADTAHQPPPEPWALEHEPVPVPSEPTELDQIGVVVVESQLGIPTTDLTGLGRMVAQLPFEPSMTVLAILAGRVEQTVTRPAEQLQLAVEFFGESELVNRYQAVLQNDPKAAIFAPQSLYILMRLLIEHARDAPITDGMTNEEAAILMRAVVASNSVIERYTDTHIGPTDDELLAYELQIGNYYARPPWLEEMTRARELYRLETEDPDLLNSADFVPVAEWLSRSGLTAEEQWKLGFALSTSSSAWDPNQHHRVTPQAVGEILAHLGLDTKRDAALNVISADRSAFQAAFTDLRATGNRYSWELRPFNTKPFLRLQDDDGLLQLGRPWTMNWLSEGFYYRAMLVAQAADATAITGPRDRVQRYTAFAGQAFEDYCLELAQEALQSGGSIVLGEQPYGRRLGEKTSDVAILIGEDLILFEANARRVGAEPLLTGDPQDVQLELTKLLVKKINQLGVATKALLDGAAALPGVDITMVKRIIPVVVSGGRFWQTGHLWNYLDSARDATKCQAFSDPRVMPLQAIDASDYEVLMGIAYRGHNLAKMLARKAEGPYRHRDVASWLAGDDQAPPQVGRLPSLEARFEAMVAELGVEKPEPEEPEQPEPEDPEPGKGESES